MVECLSFTFVSFLTRLTLTVTSYHVTSRGWRWERKGWGGEARGEREGRKVRCGRRGGAGGGGELRGGKEEGEKWKEGLKG